MSVSTNLRIVIGYDGSEEARRAVCFAARNLQVEAAVIAHVYVDSTAVAMAGPLGGAPPHLPPREREDVERQARAVAEDGLALASDAGLAASIAVRPGLGAADVAQSLLDLAVAYGADLIVVGHRHSSRLQTALLGSVSIAAVHDERRPVLVVPG